MHVARWHASARSVRASKVHRSRGLRGRNGLRYSQTHQESNVSEQSLYGGFFADLKSNGRRRAAGGPGLREKNPAIDRSFAQRVLPRLANMDSTERVGGGGEL